MAEEPAVGTSTGTSGNGAVEGDALNDQPGIIADGPWYSVLAEQGLRSNPSITKFETPDGIAKGYIELEKKLGERPSGIQPPGDNATPEDWAHFYKQIPGYPEGADKYDVTPPAPPPGAEGMPDEAFQSFLSTMHAKGATKDVVDAAARWYESFQAESWRHAEELDNRAEHATAEALKQQWGVEYDYRKTAALEYLSRAFGEDLGWCDKIISTGPDGQQNLLGNAPQFLTMAYELARVTGHAQYAAGVPGGPVSQQAARDEINQAWADRQAGRITDADYNAIQGRLGPRAYPDSTDDGLQMGSFTGVEIAEDDAPLDANPFGR